MPLEVSDMVRTDTGAVGTIVSLSDDGMAAFIQTAENGKSAGVVRYRLDRLTKVEEVAPGVV